MKRLSVVLFGVLSLSCLAMGMMPAQESVPCCGQQFVAAQDGERGRGYKPPSPEQKRVRHAQAFQRHGGRIAMEEQNTTLPPAFDCRDKGWAPPVGDQGSCGSCYLYSTTWTMTGAFLKAGYGKPDGSFLLAVQYGMDCHNFGGCGGGNGTEVIDWAVKNGGFPAESYVDASGKVIHDYPAYEARSRACRKVAGAKYWVPAEWGFCTGDQSGRPPTVSEIKTCLVNHGMLNIALDAGGQFSNGTGTITSLGNNIDHEICVVAYDDAKDGGSVLLMNQWSKDWGNNGYRWCTYKAAQRIVDWFWVSAAALPPPPPPPPAQITVACPDVTGQPGVPVIFRPTVTGGTEPYSWSFDYGDGSQGTVPSHNYAASKSYTVLVTVTDSAGVKGFASAIASIGVTPPPPPPLPGGLSIVLGPEFGDKAGRYILTPESQDARVRALVEELNRVLLPPKK